MIRTYNLTVLFYGYTRNYYNISRVAVKRYIAYHRESNPEFRGCVHDVHDSLTSH
jgi:hypothetical protein